MDPVALALGLIIFNAAAGSLNIADAARVYVRPAEIGDVLLIELENVPRLELGVAWPTTTLDVEYAPRFLWVDMLGAEPSPTLLLHNAGAQLSWRQPRYEISLTQTATVGDQDFTHVSVASDLTLQPPATMTPATTLPSGDQVMPADLGLLPRPAVLSVASEQTSASLVYNWSRRVSTGLLASFGFLGGANARSQQVLPRQRIGAIEASFDYRLSRRDDLSTGLNLTQIETSNGFDHKLASLQQSWATRWANSSGGELGAGAAIEDTTGPAGFEATKLVPIGAVSVWHALLRRSLQARFLWVAGYRPDVNDLEGTLQSQLYTTAQASLTAGRSSVRFAFGAAVTLPRGAPDANDLTSADLALDQELLEWLSLELGGQLMWQGLTGDNPLAFTGSRWLLYAGLEGRVPEVRF